MTSLAPILRFVLAARGVTCPPELESLAQRLPPVSTAGLEISLGGDGPVDLQQRIRGPEEFRRLARWLARIEQPENSWRRLRDALGRIEGSVDEIWLELDAEAAGQTGGPPVSVFARLRADGAMDTVFRVLDSFEIEVSATQRSALVQCLAECAGGACLTHLGLMLGRPGAPIRLIIERVRPDDLGSFLSGSGWPGPIETAAEFAADLFVHADRIRLALTLGETLSADIGFECFVGDPTEMDRRWRCLLDELAARGLCTPAHRERLLAWPGRLSPADTEGWPDTLIVDALLRGAQDVRWLDCRLSHVKISLPATGAPRAKGYFGFLEVQDEPEPMAPAPRLERPVSPAIDAAVAFLLDACSQSGWWVDYEGFAEGASDEWVTAYVANALLASGRPGAIDAARRAWKLLTRRARAGWGWNFLQPPDADSTIWCLQLATGLGELASAPAEDAMSFLRSHMHEDGGVATYRRDAHSEISQGAVNMGWSERHTCVTAAAAHLPSLGARPLEYLRRMQQADGVWRGYWWKSDLYTTALAAEALAATGGREDALRVARAAAAVGALSEVFLHDAPVTSAFDNALALRVLLLDPRSAASSAEQASGLLLRAQAEDGYWPASAEMAIPNRRGEILPALDNRRCFTTATALIALSKLERALTRVD